MKFLFSTLIVLFISSCKKDDSKNIEKRDFIVSKFNDDIEKRFQEAKLKNPDLVKIKVVELDDYPKGAVNFIFLKDNSVYYYNEELIWNWCGWGLDKIIPNKRFLHEDSLHQINFNKIYTFLEAQSLDKSMKNRRNELQNLSFAFENDTVKNLDVYKLLEDIDSLGYYSATIRRIAPFEINALQKRNQ